MFLEIDPMIFNEDIIKNQDHIHNSYDKNNLVRNNILNNNSNHNINYMDVSKEVFIFGFGAIVFW